MKHTLQVKPAPPAVAEACGGGAVELRELSYGQFRAAIQEGTARDAITETVLGQSLYVDGAPLGFDGLMELPGRFAAAIAEAMRECMGMHGMAKPETPTDGTKGDAAPKA